MNTRDINKILRDTAYVRVSGTSEEKQCAEYICGKCKQIGIDADLQPFKIEQYDTKKSGLFVDGKEVKCVAYGGIGNCQIEGEVYYYLRNSKASRCKDKIVIIDGPLYANVHDELYANGAKAVITYTGSLANADKDIDERAIRYSIKGILPAVNIHVSDAVEIIKKGRNAKILVEQGERLADAYNVVATLKGESDDEIIISAHYDTTSLSIGAYDNMSGCIALLYLAEYFSRIPHQKTIKLLWCGAEEIGLLGSINYCKTNNLEKAILNVNLDMLGSVTGEFVAFSCADEFTEALLKALFKKQRVVGSVRYTIRSSDSNSFIFYGVPAISYARYAANGVSQMHNRYDTADILSASRLLSDSKIIAKQIEYIANSDVEFEISEKIMGEVGKYMSRKKDL